MKSEMLGQPTYNHFFNLLSSPIFAKSAAKGAPLVPLARRFRSNNHSLKFKSAHQEISFTNFKYICLLIHSDLKLCQMVH